MEEEAANRRAALCVLLASAVLLAAAAAVQVGVASAAAVLDASSENQLVEGPRRSSDEGARGVVIDGGAELRVDANFDEELGVEDEEAAAPYHRTAVFVLSAAAVLAATAAAVAAALYASAPAPPVNSPAPFALYTPPGGTALHEPWASVPATTFPAHRLPTGEEGTPGRLAPFLTRLFNSHRRRFGARSVLAMSALHLVFHQGRLGNLDILLLTITVVLLVATMLLDQ